MQLTVPKGHDSFDVFVSLHGRDYSDHEYQQRQSIYDRRVKEVEEHNSRPDRLWTAGINHMADWTEEEFQAIRGWRGGASHQGSDRIASFLVNSVEEGQIVQEHLWNASMIGMAADQGNCGSCWAVATARMVQANHKIHTGNGRSFSAQEIISCTANPQGCGGTGGCSGATVELAMARIMEHGLSTDEDVPYRAQTGTCATPSLLQRDNEASEYTYAGMNLVELTSPGVKLAHGAAAEGINLQYWERLPVNSGAALQQRLLQGTVAVSVQAAGWLLYDGGIFDGCERDAVIDHAVLAIGFGKEQDKKYWTILNSWGVFWGENVGKIRLLRTDDDYCGMDTQPEVGTGCRNGPAKVKVCGMCGLYYDNVFARFGASNA